MRCGEQTIELILEKETIEEIAKMRGRKGMDDEEEEVETPLSLVENGSSNLLSVKRHTIQRSSSERLKQLETAQLRETREKTLQVGNFCKVFFSSFLLNF